MANDQYMDPYHVFFGNSSQQRANTTRFHNNLQVLSVCLSVCLSVLFCIGISSGAFISALVQNLFIYLFSNQRKPLTGYNFKT
jgi:hypothetical protein